MLMCDGSGQLRPVGMTTVTTTSAAFFSEQLEAQYNHHPKEASRA